MYVRKIGNRWYYTIEDRDELGNRCKHERFGGLTRAEAEKAYRQAMHAVDRTGIFYEPSTKRYPEVLEEWLTKEVEVNSKPATVSSYRGIVRNHLAKHFRRTPLRDLTPALLQDYLNGLKPKYSLATCKLIYAVLKSSLRWSVVNRRYLAVNPMENVKIPRYLPEPMPQKVFTKDQLTQIFAHYPRGHQLHMPIMLAYCTGVRLGECLALTWDDVDMDRGVIHIVRSCYDREGDNVLSSPKTAASIRDVTFSTKLKSEFNAQKLWQAQNRFKYGPYYFSGSGNYVCTQECGKKLTSNHIKAFNHWCHQTFGGLSFHSFRHTHATMLIEHGLALDYVSKRLGHSSVYTTANIYDSITDKREAEALDVMDAIL